MARPADEMRALLDAAVDGIVLMDHQGLIAAFNRAAERLFGYEAQEILGRNVTLLMAEADAAKHDDYVARYIASREPHIIGKGREVTAQRRDGSRFPAFLSVGVVEGEPPRFVGFIQDLTLRRSAERDARQLHERLSHVSRLATVGEMASGIAHQLNQPLAAIANYAQACDRLLGMADADLAEIQGALREITTQAVRAGDIIRRLLRLVRGQDGVREATDINLLVGELTDLVQTDAKTHRVRYRLELGEDLPGLEIQRAEIQQVILNLVRNAIEALAETDQEPREVIVRTSSGRGQLELSVCDTGSGVSPAVAPRLFDPFCTSKPSGTGLGLAISRTIVSRHGGTLDYRPNEPVGACFIVRLPYDASPS